MQDGCYVVLMPKAAVKRSGLTPVTDPATELIQVAPPCNPVHPTLQPGADPTLQTGADPTLHPGAGPARTPLCRPCADCRPPPSQPPSPSQVAAYPEFDGRGVAFLAEGDEEVCYMMREDARRLLHLPEHIFQLLAHHCDDEHAERNMCTHVVQFTRHKDAHLLVSAHPIFRDSAYIMGNT